MGDIVAEQIFPTKGNLIKSKRQLKQANMGYELMDRKRNILVREMVSLTEEAKKLRSTIGTTYSEAYKRYGRGTSQSLSRYCRLRQARLPHAAYKFVL